MLERRSSASRSEGESGERLVARRRRERRRLHILFGVLLLVLIGAFIWLTWQPYVRISTLTISTENAALRTLVEGELAGAYFGIVPRNSFFFVPEHAIRTAIIDFNPGFQAVSVGHEGLTSLSISLDERVPVALWCGLEKTPDVPEYCYVFDAEGYLYAAADVATSTPVLNSFALYAPLEGDTLEPLRATLSHATQLPNLFDFARKLSSLGSPVTTITIRGDECDLMLQSGTRVTYVLGAEEGAMADLRSAEASLSFADGSLLYVDLRFAGKVYLKRQDGSVSE